MSPAPSPNRTQDFEAALARLEGEAYELRLYVVGMTEGSRAAIRNITAICDAHLLGRYTLEVVDLYQHPVLHEGDEIIAAPTLILWGERDAVLPPTYAKKFADGINGSTRVQTVADAGHLAYLDQPDAVARAVLAHFA